jgi:histone-lysine N-methyltransferase SETMAR
MTAKIKELNLEILDHPPYSLHFAPSNYHLFRSLQNHLNNKKFERFEEVNDAILAYFESKPRSFFKARIEKLVTRETVIASSGNYKVKKKKSKVVPLHAMEAHGGRGGIAATHS